MTNYPDSKQRMDGKKFILLTARLQSITERKSRRELKAVSHEISTVKSIDINLFAPCTHLSFFGLEKFRAQYIKWCCLN